MEECTFASGHERDNWSIVRLVHCKPDPSNK
jgi:hypothetical protein